MHALDLFGHFGVRGLPQFNACLGHVARLQAFADVGM
jgi:hypothetical protein